MEYVMHMFLLRAYDSTLLDFYEFIGLEPSPPLPVCVGGYTMHLRFPCTNCFIAPIQMISPDPW